jgi:Fe-Mn family superoxide dismutase
MEHTLPELQYPYNSLEPHIDEETMRTHHDKHHQGYVNKLNKALENYPELQELSLEELLMDLDSVPEDIRTAVKNNGGGHFAHTLFWSIMSPKPAEEPKENLKKLIVDNFGSLINFKSEFSEKAGSLFGSGWTWLVKQDDNLDIVQAQGHDIPISEERKPIMVLDVWEHAYYLKYKNERGKYIQNWWKILDWSKIEIE